MAALGVVAGFEDADGVAGDLGGGSLELIEVLGKQIGRGDSLLLGGLRLQTTSRGSLRTARELARTALEASPVTGRLDGRIFYAIGGTWRSLARLYMHDRGYPLNVMHDYRISASELSDFLKLLSRGPLDTIPGINVVSKQRQALLPFGAVVLSEILRAGKPSCVKISALGGGRGWLLQAQPRRAGADPLLLGARELSLLRSLLVRSNGEELIGWSPGHRRARYRENARRNGYATAACLLSDIGWRAPSPITRACRA
jgi:exopolyphosphatase/guanosine-5'-triphosphate,3'-diphosphate pyrophosphatase